ncbi:MAG: FxsA family protein [Campylobacterota bacterium]|nr:FxsA family protein [Campylobacterota bacterium]
MIFVLVPILLLELYISLKVGENIGFLWSVVWILISMFIGIKLLKYSPLSLMGNMQAVQTGKLSTKSFHNAATSYLAGSVLLIIPGVLSDFLGVVAFVYTLYLQFIAKITPEQTNLHTKKGDDNVIDVEIIE